MMSKCTFVLDNVRSAFNVGSIFRTADGLNYEIDLIGITPIPGIDTKLEKTSLSTLNSVKWQYFKNFEEWYLNYLSKDNSILIVVENFSEKFKDKAFLLFDISSKINLSNYSHIYLVLGHEINGVSQDFLDKSDYIIKIPMYGQKNSLNVANCAGIVGYFIKYSMLTKH